MFLILYCSWCCVWCYLFFFFLLIFFFLCLLYISVLTSHNRELVSLRIADMEVSSAGEEHQYVHPICAGIHHGAVADLDVCQEQPLIVSCCKTDSQLLYIYILLYHIIICNFIDMSFLNWYIMRQIYSILIQLYGWSISLSLLLHFYSFFSSCLSDSVRILNYMERSCEVVSAYLIACPTDKQVTLYRS